MVCFSTPQYSQYWFGNETKTSLVLAIWSRKYPITCPLPTHKCWMTADNTPSACPDQGRSFRSERCSMYQARRAHPTVQHKHLWTIIWNIHSSLNRLSESFYFFGLCLANRGVCYIVFANVHVPRASGNVCLAFRPTVWQVLICRYCVTGSCKLKQLSEVAVYKEHHHLTLFSWEFCKGERRDRQKNEGIWNLTFIALSRFNMHKVEPWSQGCWPSQHKEEWCFSLESRSCLHNTVLDFET